LIKEMSAQPHLTSLMIDPSLAAVEQVSPAPKCRLKISKPSMQSKYDQTLQAELTFDYGGAVFGERDRTAAHYDAEKHKLVFRDSDAETAAERKLASLGVKREWSFDINGQAL